MIEITNTDVFGLEGAIRGMRNPLASHKKSDSDWTIDQKDDGVLFTYYKVGSNDLDLMKRLASAGPSDRKYLRMIHVQCDIEAPLYWYKEMDQYKVATTSNSYSTMHKIQSKPITMENISCEDIKEGSEDAYTSMQVLINLCEDLRKKYVETKDKKYWRALIQMLPSSWNQKRTYDFNYETLIGMYFSRRYHKLTEWHTMCDWILTLPYMKDLVETLDTKKEA